MSPDNRGLTVPFLRITCPKNVIFLFLIVSTSLQTAKKLKKLKQKTKQKNKNKKKTNKWASGKQ